MDKKYKILLSVTAVFEGTTGLALILAPAHVVSLLLNATLTEPVGIVLGKLAGSALLSLTIICWLNRSENRGAAGVIVGMFFYNMAATVLLIYAWSEGFSGMALWPAVLLHTGLAIWCIKVSYTSKPS